MPNPNFVCTICSQSFTRRWRGRVHNNDIHAGLAKIVRLVDYIIGRINGEYLPSDPSLYRRKRRSTNSTKYPVESNIEHMAWPYDLNAGQDRNQKYHTSDSRTVSDPIQQFNEALIKMAELKKLTSKYCPPKMVQDILSQACKDCASRGNNRSLDIALEVARKMVEAREARDYLEGP
jgi:hypothetical protein